MKQLKYGKAICYSGYRENQSPLKMVYPTYEEVKEDLLMLEREYDYIRMYDPSDHAKTAAKVIRDLNLNLKMMVGIDLRGEESNPNCAWGGDYSDEEVIQNIQYNEASLKDLITLANEYEDVIVSVSAGNEATPEWNENLVQPQRVLYFVNELKKYTNQLVTYCENCAYWNTILVDVAEAVDFISIHTYPAWAGIEIDNAFEVSTLDFNNVQDNYPDKPCIITEAGWPTTSHGRGIDPNKANEVNQVRYHNDIMKWSEDTQTIVFFFEAFDEPWKGSSNPNEPEKHWGIYFADRTPKKVVK